MLEMSLDKNLAQMSRTRDSSDIITRLYVEGEYGDLGYIGIDDVNPTGLNFLLNFDYYRSIGALSAEQEQALTNYLTGLPSIKSLIMSTTALMESAITTLQTQWGSQGYLCYSVNNTSGQRTIVYPPIYGNGATDADDLQIGDTAAFIEIDGTYTYAQVTNTAISQ